MLKTIEIAFEKFLFRSRWLAAPFYLGLVLGLVVLLIVFTKKLFVFVGNSFNASEEQVIVGILSLIDLTLAAGLVLIVIFSGYENFVSKIDSGDHPDWPDWMGKVDFTGLKLKLLSSIVAISAISVLKAFMDITKYSDRDLIWLVTIHGVFVGSGILLALTDKIADSKKSKPGKDAASYAGSGGKDGGMPGGLDKSSGPDLL